MARLLKKSEAAEQLGVTERHVETLMERRLLPFIKLGPARNSSVRIDQADLDRFVRQNRIA